MSSTNKEKQTNQYVETFSAMQKLETVGALWDCEMHITTKNRDCETGEIWQMLCETHGLEGPFHSLRLWIIL